MRRALELIIIAGICTSACTMVEPANPFDPNADKALQQKSIVIGRVLSPAGLDVSNLTDAVVRLSSPDPTIEAIVTNPNVDGLFTFEPVMAGFYHLNIERAGLFSAPRFFEVPIGSRIILGGIPLEPVLGRISGRVILAGKGYAVGALVAANEPGYRTAVGLDGRFTLTVPSGEHEISIASPGYVTQTVTGIEVAARQDVTLAGRVVLSALKGIVAGQVGLRQFVTPRRLGRIIIELEENDAGGPPLPDGGYDSTTGDAFFAPDAFFEAETDAQLTFPPPLTSVGVAVPDRQFTIPRLEPGRYSLRFSAGGYDTQRRPGYVTSERTSAIGRVELAHSSSGPEAVSLDGRIISGDFGIPGIVVDVVFDPGMVNLERTQPLLFDRAITDIDGNFNIPAARGEFYRIRVNFPEDDEKQDVDFGPVRYVDPVGFIDAEGNSPHIEVRARDVVAPDPG